MIDGGPGNREPDDSQDHVAYEQLAFKQVLPRIAGDHHKAGPRCGEPAVVGSIYAFVDGHRLAPSGGFGFRLVVHWPERTAFHGGEEDVLERIAPVVHTANLDAVLSSNRVDTAHLDIYRQYDLDAAIFEPR